MTEYFNYVLRCSDGTFYSGFTTDPARRLAAHNAGKGAKYTRSRRPVTVAALWQWPDRSAAMRAEWRVKRGTRAQKEALVARMTRLEGGRRVSEKRLKRLLEIVPSPRARGGTRGKPPFRDDGRSGGVDRESCVPDAEKA